MITAEIMGGLGNQLYIIFTLISYSLTSKNAFYFENKEIINGDRKIMYWNNLLKGISIFIKPCKPINTIIREKSMNYEILPTIDTVIDAKLHGYFQSFKYFDNSKEEILKLIKFIETTKPYENLYDFENSISMHFRLGDYKSKQGFHPILKLNYYKRSLQHMIEKNNFKKWQILYFCENEDIKFVENVVEELKVFFPDLSFLRANNMLADWEQMVIMSLCAHNIIANSTFSWWSAYLNTNLKIVCCPNIILGPDSKVNIKFEDRYPSTWTIIDAT